MTDNKFVCNKMQCFGTRRMIYLFTVRDIYALTKKYCFNTIFSLEYFILCPLNPKLNLQFFLSIENQNINCNTTQDKH